MPDLYVLDSAGRPVREHDVLAWAAWLKATDVVIAADDVGDVVVSTVFLAQNRDMRRHKDPNRAPVLWETLVSWPGGATRQDRYASREAALAGHARWVEQLRQDQSPPPG